MKTYKLFRIKDGKLYPLYVNANKETAIGKWIEAEAGERLVNGKVKSRLGGLAYRPGWHSSDVPVALHIGEKENKGDKAPSYRPDNQVWCECEVKDTKSSYWSDKADKAGKNPKDKQLKEIPVHGWYRYKTNPNMYGSWIISGEIKIIRILSDTQVYEINAKHGVHDLPRRKNCA